LTPEEVAKVLAGGNIYEENNEGTKEELLGFKLLILFIMFAECYIGLIPKACGGCMKN